MKQICYIKDIRFPANCRSCDLKQYGGYGNLYCPLIRNYLDLKKAEESRHECCPLRLAVGCPKGDQLFTSMIL